MQENSVLVIAFDGLDAQLVEKFDLDYLVQGEHGTIDNKTDISQVKTSELFATFITGENYEEHGVKGLKTWENPYQGKFIEIVTNDFLQDNIRGFTRLEDVLKAVFDTKKYLPEKEDLDSKTFFDRIDNSKAMFVPGYDNSIMKETGAHRVPMRFGYVRKNLKKYYDSREYDFRKRSLLRPVNSWFDFLMCHFQRVDYHQHSYGDKDVNYNEEVLEEIYEETDELAEEIIEFFEDEYDYIIFMSDHGLPTEEGHNENAFYSCNIELFGDEIPHVTDFHDKILELTGNEDKIDSS